MISMIITFIDNFILGLSGADVALIRRPECDADRSTYRARGLLVLFLGLVVGIFGYIAISNSAPPQNAALMATVWALLFMIVERLVLSGLLKRRGQKGLKQLAVVSARLVLALGVGFAVSKLVTVAVFKGPIERRIAESNLAELREARVRADAVLRPDVERTTQDRDRLVGELGRQDSLVAEAFRIAEEEGAGRRSPESGAGPLYTADTARAHLLNRHLERLRMEYTPKISVLNSRLDSLAGERAQLVAIAGNAQKADLADRLEALELLQLERPAIARMALLFVALFIGLDLLAAVLKVSDTGRDSFEALVDRIRTTVIAEQDAAADVAAHAAAVSATRQKAEADFLAASVVAAFAKSVGPDAKGGGGRGIDDLTASILKLDAEFFIKQATAGRDHGGPREAKRESPRDEGGSPDAPSKDNPAIPNRN